MLQPASFVENSFSYSGLPGPTDGTDSVAYSYFAVELRNIAAQSPPEFPFRFLKVQCTVRAMAHSYFASCCPQLLPFNLPHQLLEPPPRLHCPLPRKSFSSPSLLPPPTSPFCLLSFTTHPPRSSCPPWAQVFMVGIYEVEVRSFSVSLAHVSHFFRTGAVGLQAIDVFFPQTTFVVGFVS